MELVGQKRQKIGKIVKNLRDEGLIPAVVFGNEMESTAIVINTMAFGKLFAKAGETALIDLKIDSDDYKVLVNDVQYNPVSGKIIHASFYKPNLKEKTEVHIPVEVIGEETNPLVKTGEAVVLQLMNEILVKALPADLPEAFVIDVTNLAEIGSGVVVGQLTYDREKVEILHLDADELVVKLDNAIMEEEPTAAAGLEGEMTEQEKIAAMEAIKEKKPEEDEEEADGKDSKKK